MKEAPKHFHNIFEDIVKKFKKLLGHFIMSNLKVLNSLYRTYPNAASFCERNNYFKDSAKCFEENEISGNIIRY